MNLCGSSQVEFSFHDSIDDSFNIFAKSDRIPEFIIFSLEIYAIFALTLRWAYHKRINKSRVFGIAGIMPVVLIAYLIYIITNYQKQNRVCRKSRYAFNCTWIRKRSRGYLRIKSTCAWRSSLKKAFTSALLAQTPTISCSPSSIRFRRSALLCSSSIISILIIQ